MTNTGDASAMLTENGLEIIAVIEPGQTKHYTNIANVSRMKGNEKPLTDFIKLIDESEKTLKIQFNINYRPANDKEKLFKVTGQYFVGKHNITRISDSSHMKEP